MYDAKSRIMLTAYRKQMFNFDIQSLFTVKNPRVRLVEVGHMTTLCVSIPQSLSALIKSCNALRLLQLSIHSKTVQISIQVLVMNSEPASSLIFFSKRKSRRFECRSSCCLILNSDWILNELETFRLLFLLYWEINCTCN